MTSHIGVLPAGILDSVFAKLDETKQDLRFLRLPHPRTGVPSLFLPYQSPSHSAILEVQAVAPLNERSWFMSDDEVVDNGKMLLMTPVDPAFLLLPILQAAHSSDGNLGNFQPIDDIFEDAVEKLLQNPPSPPNSKDTLNSLCPKDLSYLWTFDCVQLAMKRVCEVKDITPEIVVYRYSPERLIEYLKTKVARLSTPGMFETSNTLVRNLAKDGLMEDGKETLLESGRLRAACDLISQYIPQNIYDTLLASYDFTALNMHYERVQLEQAAVVAARMSAVEAKESKSSASKENSKKRKGAAKASHGVEKLKKVNTRGMAKLSTFFQKAAES